MIKAIYHDSSILKPEGIRKVEEAYDAKYVASFAIPGHIFKDVFYVKNPDISKGHRHYFGMMRRPGSQIAITAVENIDDRDPNSNYVSLCGFVCEDTFYYSGDRHDLVMAPDGRWIDGGLYYTRSSCEITHFLILADGGPEISTRHSYQPMTNIRHVHRGYP